jgi:hypothetical protein
MILSALLVVSALVMNGLLQEYMNDASIPKEDRRKVYKYFGSFSRSVVSIFEISFASHAPMCRTIMENVSEWYAVFFLLYKCVVGLSVFKVISGVFLHETFKVCTEDDELMVIQKRRAKKTWTAKMEKLFAHFDDDDDGIITWTEFENVIKHNEEVSHWLSAMDLDITNVERLWHLIDDGDGSLSAPELVTGISKLKGPSRSIDTHHTAQVSERMSVMMKEVHDMVQKLQQQPPVCSFRLNPQAYAPRNESNPTNITATPQHVIVL